MLNRLQELGAAVGIQEQGKSIHPGKDNSLTRVTPRWGLRHARLQIVHLRQSQLGLAGGSDVEGEGIRDVTRAADVGAGEERQHGAPENLEGWSHQDPDELDSGRAAGWQKGWVDWRMWYLLFNTLI